VIFEPGDPILYMKVGTHAQEDLGEILDRKRKEIEREGFAMWGYGGNTCHPASMVQPFAKQADRPIILCMQPMKSRHAADPIRAEEYSADRSNWLKIPNGINVLGSQFALCIRSLEEVDANLDLAETKVALGNSRGQPGDKYIRGRVDKACLEVLPPRDPLGEHRVHIRVVAEIIEPFAVWVRRS
jgi:hypothetical protein